MRNSRALFMVASGFVATGCLGDGKVPSKAALPQPIHLSSKLLTRSDSLGQPASLAVAGSLLVFSDAKGPPFLHFIDRGTGQIVRSLGRQGAGPGDFDRGVYLVPIDSATVLAWDGGSGRATIIYPHAPERDQLRLTTLFAVPSFDPVAFDTGQLIGANIAGESEWRWQTVRPNGEVTKLEPLVLDDDRQADNLWMGYQNARCASPSRRRIAVTYLRAGRIDIVDSLGRNVVRAATPDTAKPPVGTNAEGRAAFDPMTPGMMAYYGACYATNRRIYAHYFGAPNDAKGYSARLTQTRIHLFAWDGRFLGELVFDGVFFHFAVDQVDETLYFATADSNGVEVRTAELPATVADQ